MRKTVEKSCSFLKYSGIRISSANRGNCFLRSAISWNKKKPYLWLPYRIRWLGERESLESNTQTGSCNTFLYSILLQSKGPPQKTPLSNNIFHPHHHFWGCGESWEGEVKMSLCRHIQPTSRILPILDLGRRLLESVCSHICDTPLHIKRDTYWFWPGKKPPFTF